MPTIVLEVKGTPRPQPRPRFVRGRVVSTADANARRWSNTVEVACRSAASAVGMIESPLAIVLHFRFATKDKSRHDTPHTSRPDADNLAKLVMDAATRSGLIGDDAGVARLMIMKTWSNEAGMEAALATLTEVDTATPSPTEKPRWLVN